MLGRKVPDDLKLLKVNGLGYIAKPALTDKRLEMMQSMSRGVLPSRAREITSVQQWVDGMLEYRKYEHEIREFNLKNYHENYHEQADDGMPW